MLLNDQVMSHSNAEHMEPFGAQWGMLPRLRLVPPLRETHGVEAQADASVRAAVDAWSTECGLTVQDFQRHYLEECVADLLDQHPTIRRQDAERLALAAETWLEDRAA